jgi:hypothetical protein
MGLALGIGLTGLPLGIERVEFEVEVVFGRFASLDGTAQQLVFIRLHHRLLADERAPFRVAGFATALLLGGSN